MSGMEADAKMFFLSIMRAHTRYLLYYLESIIASYVGDWHKKSFCFWLSAAFINFYFVNDNKCTERNFYSGAHTFVLIVLDVEANLGAQILEMCVCSKTGSWKLVRTQRILRLFLEMPTSCRVLLGKLKILHEKSLSSHPIPLFYFV